MPHSDFELRLTSRELHLAAYLKFRGYPLNRMDRGSFIFVLESPEHATQLRVDHSNSEALKVDRELLTLKKFL